MQAELLARIIGANFWRATGMPATSFGRRAVRDPRLVSDLRAGRIPGAQVRARVEEFILDVRMAGRMAER